MAAKAVILNFLILTFEFGVNLSLSLALKYGDLRAVFKLTT